MSPSGVGTDGRHHDDVVAVDDKRALFPHVPSEAVAVPNMLRLRSVEVVERPPEAGTGANRAIPESRAAAAEVGIDHDVVALGAVEYGVCNQRDWLCRRVAFQLFSRASTREAVGSWRIPHIRSVAAEATEAAELANSARKPVSAVFTR